MAKDETRTAQLKDHAVYLDDLAVKATGEEKGKLMQMAHDLRKFSALVLDRDAGPTLEVKAECNRLRTELNLANGVAKELDLEYAAYRDKTKAAHHENARLKDEVKGLKNTVAKISGDLAKAEAKTNAKTETVG